MLRTQAQAATHVVDVGDDVVAVDNGRTAGWRNETWFNGRKEGWKEMFYLIDAVNTF